MPVSVMTNLSEVMGIFSDILSKRTKDQQKEGLDAQVKARRSWAGSAAGPQPIPKETTPGMAHPSEKPASRKTKGLIAGGRAARSAKSDIHDAEGKYRTPKAVDTHEKREAMRREGMLESQWGGSDPLNSRYRTQRRDTKRMLEQEESDADFRQYLRENPDHPAENPDHPDYGDTKALERYAEAKKKAEAWDRKQRRANPPKKFEQNMEKALNIFSDILSKRTKGQQDKGLDTQVKARPRWASEKGKPLNIRPVGKDDPRGQDYGKRTGPEGLIAPSDSGLANPKVPAKYVTWNAIDRHQKREAMRRERMLESHRNPHHRITPSPKDRKRHKENRREWESMGGELWEGEGIYDMEKSLSGQQPIKGNFIPRPNPKKNTTSDDEDKATVLHHGQLVKESPRPVPGTSPRNSDPTVGRGKKAGFTLESETTSPDKSTYVYTMEKASEDKGGLSSDENADRLNEEAFRRQAITRRGFNPKYGEAGSEVYNRSRPPSSTRRKQLQDRFRRQVIEDNQLNMEKADPPDPTENVRNLNEDEKLGRVFDKEYYAHMEREREAAEAASVGEGGLPNAAELRDVGTPRHMYQSDEAMDRDPDIRRHKSVIRRDKAKNLRAYHQGSLAHRKLRDEQLYNMVKARTNARIAAKYQARKPKPSIMEQRKPADIQPEDPNKPKQGQWKGGKWRELLKARKNNIYAIATAAANGDEDKKEEIVRALKRGKMILKAFGIMKASPWKHRFGQPQIEDEDEHGYATAPPHSYYSEQHEPMEFHHGLQMGTGNPKLGQTREERGARTPKAVLASRKGKPARHKNYAAVQRRKKAEAQQVGESTTPAQTGTAPSKPVEAILKAFGVQKAYAGEDFIDTRGTSGTKGARYVGMAQRMKDYNAFKRSGGKGYKQFIEEHPQHSSDAILGAGGEEEEARREADGAVARATRQAEDAERRNDYEPSFTRFFSPKARKES